MTAQDVGIWLETDWYRRQAVIKEIKKDSYAFTNTDVHVRRPRSFAFPRIKHEVFNANTETNFSVLAEHIPLSKG